ncbi:MAG: hypothetical protein V3W41_01870 [Planctomycetota bacterium]
MKPNTNDLPLLPIIMGEVFGPTVVIGTQRRDLLPVIAASASELQLLATKPVVMALEEEIGDLIAAPIRRLDPRVVEEALSNREAKRRRKRAKSRSEGALASLVVLGPPPEGELLAQIELQIVRLVHDGVFLIDTEMESNAKRKLMRVLESVLDEFRWLSDSSSDRVQGWGRRHAPGREPAFASHDAASVTAVVYARGNPDEVNPLVVDLLFRQNTPPALVLILDDADPNVGEDPVPEDLWGLAAYAESQPALLKTGGLGRGAAYAEAVKHIETDLCVFYEGRERLVPNHIGIVAAALAHREDWVAAASRVLAVDDQGQARGLTPGLSGHEVSRTAGLIERGGLAPSALVVRSSALKELGFDPALKHRPLRRLELGLSDLGAFGDIPLALSFSTQAPRPRRPQELEDERRILEEFNANCEIGKLAAGRQAAAQWQRREAAQLMLARALEGVSSTAAALTRYRAVVSAAPEGEAEGDRADDGARLAAAALMLETGDIAEARSWLAAASGAGDAQRRPLSWELRLALATAQALAGESEEALAALETLIAERPSNPVAHWNRIALFAAAERSGGMQRALRDLDQQALGLRAHPDGKFLLTRFAAPV